MSHNGENRKRAQSDLSRFGEFDAIRILAGGFAHDFNSLLSLISGHSTLLRENFQANEEIKVRVQAIEKAVERAVELTQKLNGFSNPEREVLGLLPVASLVDEVVVLLRKALPKSVMVTTDIASDLWPMMGARQQIVEGLFQIGLSATETMHTGGVITLKASNELISEDPLYNPRNLTPGPYIHLTLMDTGHGREEAVTHLLSRSTIDRVVERHKAKMFVESKVDFGTAYHLYFRSESPVPAETECRSNPSAIRTNASSNLRLEMASRPLKFWVVEDDCSSLDLLQAILAPLGSVEESAINGIEALSKIEDSQCPDLILLDIGLSRINGYHIFDQLRLKWPNLPIIFITGLSENEIKSDYLFKPNVLLLQKPFDSTELRTKILELTSSLMTGELNTKALDVGSSRSP